VLTTYTDPDKPETINAFAKLLIDQIELLIEQLTTEGYLRVKPPPAPANPNPRGPKI
jgi:hypothetical protein